MGVHDLWSIVEPIRESVPLYSLSGKTLAVDLSLWVCEAQHVHAMMGKVTKPHLRNLFFRVSSLTLMGVKLVFVMEGEAPKLKAETMSKRTETRYGGFKKAPTAKPSVNTNRGRFKAVLRECAEMLDYLGVPWVTAAGEAEAMCAYLDSQGLVDGCITNDGDAFLYGARTVYRNFNMNSKDPQVECYQTSRVETELHLSRENLVGLAILLGCDYIPKGIPGVGKEQALRLIHTLKGQTLLQRFSQWKEENADVPGGAVKKVAHCNICRHPGSVKAHERAGCVLCDSQRFCQPQDFDYQCPCEWHRYEQTRQALSFEANIRRKTLASVQFPFTEIIREFLVSKDKPVSHFKRRQPNMLLMQKYALDKMEWPKHYTSEKVLVLMTYTELMNRKYRRDMSSQIKPIRILKPRVRNAIACYEIIWGTPEHYVFPEDYPAENQHEVRTVEEESLFHAAYPQVVEHYLRDKAMAEENKKKKPKSKKKQMSDASDGLSDLMAQMTLQSSSSSSAEPLKPPLLPTSSNSPDVVILDTPVNQKQNRKDREDRFGPHGCSNTSPSHVESEAAASPSVSAIIDALHLSDIDWEALSFTSSPNHSTEPKLSETTDTGIKEMGSKKTEQKTSSDTKQAESRCAPQLSHTECRLIDRVLMRNTAQAVNEGLYSVVTKQLHYDSLSSEHHSTSSGQMPDKGSNDSNLLQKDSNVNKKEPLTDKSQDVTGDLETQNSNKQVIPKIQGQSKIKKKTSGPKRPPQKYKFVRSAVSSLAVPPQRCHSDPPLSDRDTSLPQTTKKSVCMSVCSSSEDSDVENRQSGPQRLTKLQPVHKMKSSLVPDVSLKPVSTKPAAKPATLIRPKAQSNGAADETRTPIPTKNKSQDVPPASVDDDVFLQTPASPVIQLDSDESVICSDSPLPLAERLRLKFMK